MNEIPFPARPFVIAIGGPSGSGKSSLVQRTAHLLGDALTLFFDDYASVSTYPTDFAAWIRAGANPNDWKTPHFARDLTALRQGQPLSPPGNPIQLQSPGTIVVEEPFGRARQEMRELVDLVAIIDLPLEVALARRMRRNIQAGLADGAASVECLRSLGQFLDAYLDGHVREGYQIIQRTAAATCDLLLDGLMPVDELAEQVVRMVRSRTQ